jgi:hypothetical protein
MEAFKRFLSKLAAWTIAIAAIVTAGWLWVSLKYVYSSGERAGYIQKFSQKGWVIKTWEGDLAMVNLPGALSERFAFTVRNDDVAKKISDTMGQRVVITYDQHRFLPGTAFGETEYFVVDVRPEVDPAQSTVPSEAAPAVAPKGSI